MGGRGGLSVSPSDRQQVGQLPSQSFIHFIPSSIFILSFSRYRFGCRQVAIDDRHSVYTFTANSSKVNTVSISTSFTVALVSYGLLKKSSFEAKSDASTWVQFIGLFIFHGFRTLTQNTDSKGRMIFWLRNKQYWQVKLISFVLSCNKPRREIQFKIIREYHTSCLTPLK